MRRRLRRRRLLRRLLRRSTLRIATMWPRTGRSVAIRDSPGGGGASDRNDVTSSRSIRCDPGPTTAAASRGSPCSANSRLAH